jgi:hypothetical protein
MSNLLVGRCPTKPAGIDEISINEKPAVAKAMAGEVGRTGQLSNQFIQDLKEISSFNEQNPRIFNSCPAP